MAKATDNQPALDALCAIGYVLVAEIRHRAIRNYYRMREPSGRERKLHILKSGAESGGSGRHRFGITRVWELVDDFVFWASGERVILVIPGSVLRRFYNDCTARQITASGQWVVNIYFDINSGNQILCPVNDGHRHSVSQYARNVPPKH